ncbi:MAG: FAD-dependent oxidoreductase [Acidimicrobiia bacterium]|nr:FAD-dependent oxidoreductase [Acidimicrobiia bacterium]
MSTVAAATPRALWLDRLNLPIRPRPPLDGDRQTDVAIVGGGFSGLWTAYYLSRADPSLRIAVLERQHCGFGASGRNGGWACGELGGTTGGTIARYARRSSHTEAMRLIRALFDAVDEIGRVSQSERIDCDYAKGGTVRLARNAPQAKRQREEIDELRAQGFTEEEIRLLDAAEARRHLNATGVRSGILLAPSAALDPAKLVVGLAEVVEAAGVAIYEQTAVAGLGPRRVRTTHGTVTADVVVRATEAYTRDLAGQRRAVLPVYSLMIATEPLPADVIAEIGLPGRPTFSDDRHMVIYGQRTADDRIAFGGRGVPYLYGSRIDARTELDEPSHQLIHDTLVELLPPLAGARVTHRWGGVLAIPRDWLPGLRYDRVTGLGIFGGYVGTGVACANLAGRTMAELILGAETERTGLPWVGTIARRWAPEPFRWLGVRSSRRILRAADDREFRTDREARAAYRLSRILRGAGR